MTRNYHFNLINLKIGLTKKVECHPGSNKLYVSKIQLGSKDSPTKQVCSGLRDVLPRESFEGKLVVVVDNMKKCKLRGQVSEAMVLCGQDSKGNIQLCRPAKNGPLETLVGRAVLLEGQEEMESSLPVTRKIKPREWEDISSSLYVGDNNVVVYREKDATERALFVGDLPIVVDNLPKGSNIY